ncbi:hypothetical protein [Cochlodiniinecator piscidefendens]|uniref:hypothetical protein n=1 Tax=Cochlodiniinecator piscidefendens TaxID=2715756 RepID=UPI00140CA617|nr:hypothetical protein [Cochlodiniinecator piscidefendens]
MADRKNDSPIDLGVYDAPEDPKVTPAELIAIVLSVAWMGLTALFFFFASAPDSTSTFDPLNFVMTLLAIFLPIAVIWIGAMAARSSRTMKQESARLQAAIDGMRQTYLQQSHAGGVNKTSVEKKLDEIAAAQRMTETALVTFTSSREREDVAIAKPALPAPPIDDEGQTALALGTTAEDITNPLSTADFIRALNFPENEHDVEGFNALRRALKSRETAKLVQAAQDALTLLSQDGIYMDDLRPDLARPDIWRKFADGERGRTIAALGGIRDRSSLALTSGRMRKDTIFRDVAHHFLRQFDKSFVTFVETATDQDIAELSATRTARAFMLLGRVTGTFD